MKNSRKPRLGQHFLTSTGALDSILGISQIIPEDVVLEIGPGKGILTEQLVRSADKVLAVEKDQSLVSFLQSKFAKEITDGKLELREQDILDFDPEILATYGPSYKIIANIPYYITGEIIRKFLTAAHKPQSMTLLVQKEVAERIARNNGKESILSLSVKFFGTPTYVQTVKRGSFSPPPNVDSAILHISDIVQPQNTSEEKFFELVKAGFKSKRKKLISNLSEVVAKEKGREKLAKMFDELSLDENVRAEDVNLETWKNLTLFLA